MISLRLWTDGDRVISTRCRRLFATEDVLEALRSGNGPYNAISLLVEWIDRLVWRMTDTIDSFEDELARVEDAVLSENLEGLRFDLSGLRKKTIMIRRYLAPQREALNRICSEPIGWIDEMNRLRLREVADRQIRHLEDIDTIRERAAMTQEELLSRVSEQMNARTFVLTIVAAIFLPLGFFTGLLGVNVGGIPGMEDKAAFWIVVAICLGLTGALGVLFRFKRWL
jgi:zinc transporter